MGEKKKGGCSGVIWIIILVVGAYFVVTNFLNTQVYEYQEKQKDPENAMKFYLKTTNRFIQDFAQKGGTFDDLYNCVLREDWDWYDSNYKQLLDDLNIFVHKDLYSKLASGDAETMGRWEVLKYTLKLGPHFEGSTVINKRIEGNKAVLTIQELTSKEDGENHYENYEVTLIKKGKYWKVKDFAGGRSKVEKIRK